MGQRIRRYFISGLLVFLPLSMTIYLLILTINAADSFFGRFLEPYFAKEFGFYFKGLSLLVWATLLIFIGFLATNYFGRQLQIFLEKILLRLPFFKQVYPAMKEISNFFLAENRTRRFKQVVFVEYPRRGMYALGFITNTAHERVKNKIGESELYHVFLPSSPGPFTGYMAIVPESDLIFSDMTVEQGIKLLVSGGVVNPF